MFYLTCRVKFCPHDSQSFTQVRHCELCSTADLFIQNTKFINERTSWDQYMCRLRLSLKEIAFFTLRNDHNGGIWQKGISKSLAEYVQCRVCFVNGQSSLHENVLFSVCTRMGNTTYIIGSHYLAPEWWQLVHYSAPQTIWWQSLHCSAP